MLRFAATKPLSNFFLFMLLIFLTAYFGENISSTKLQILIDFLISVILFGYWILWPLGAFKYLVRNGGDQLVYSRLKIDKWVLLSTSLICVWIPIQEYCFEVTGGFVYYVIGAPVVVFWLIVYGVLCWNVSMMLDILYSRKYLRQILIPSFWGFLVWPVGGILFAGDRLSKFSSGHIR